MGRVERGGKGGSKARHTAVFGLERSSGKNVTVSSSSRPFTFIVQINTLLVFTSQSH